VGEYNHIGCNWKSKWHATCVQGLKTRFFLGIPLFAPPIVVLEILLAAHQLKSDPNALMTTTTSEKCEVRGANSLYPSQ